MLKHYLLSNRLILTLITVATISISSTNSAHANTSTQSNFTNKQVKFELPMGWTLGEVAAIVKKNNGNFVLFHRGKHQLLEFDSNYRFKREIGPGLFKDPHGLRIDKDQNIWTTDAATHLVMRFSPQGELTMVLGKNNLAGTGWFDRDYNLTLFNKPLDVAFDRFNNIYVVDKGNERIVKLDSNGLFIKSWGSKGSNSGEFNFVHSIVIDSKDNIYVADRENRRIQLFTLNGKFIDQWSNVGYPYVLVLNQGSLWATDARAEQVNQFNLKGERVNYYQGDIGRNPGQFNAVHGIYVGQQNKLWVTQIFNWGGVNQLTARP